MKPITLLHPNKLVFGNGCSNNFVEDYLKTGNTSLLLLTAEPVLPVIENIIDELKRSKINLTIHDSIAAEPGVTDFEKLVSFARNNNIDSVVGIGGGSVLDLAKLVAALINGEQTIQDVFGIGNLKKRDTYLACLPTTSGTGSEVSPNAILLDEKENLKKGAVSPFLVPDAAYIDPVLTRSVPPHVTAATGMDALTHCMEAYTNKFAHPVVDLFAYEGMRLINDNLEACYLNGEDLDAREKVALGSVYGGLCLGPVNTAAVHALSYPLGGEFHIPHGLSNSVLLPYVMKFNAEAATKKYSKVGEALGITAEMTDQDKAAAGVERIFELCKKLYIPDNLSKLNIPKNKIPNLAESALKVERLLKNNPRNITYKGALEIYKEAYG